MVDVGNGGWQHRRPSSSLSLFQLGRTMYSPFSAGYLHCYTSLGLRGHVLQLLDDLTCVGVTKKKVQVIKCLVLGNPVMETMQNQALVVCTALSSLFVPIKLSSSIAVWRERRNFSVRYIYYLKDANSREISPAYSSDTNHIS